MNQYPHIDSVYKRDQKGKFILGDYSTPEFDYLKDCPWEWTEKIDGTNIRIMYDGKDVRYGGKTDNAQLPTKLVNWLNEHLCANDGSTDIGLDLAFNPYTFHRLFGGEGNICLYGEGYGAGIQKVGAEYSDEQKFILFDVKVGNWWLSKDSVADIANKLNLHMVPYHGIDTLAGMVDNVATRANNPPRSRYGTALIEGYVGTPLVPLYTRKGERIIVKVKYKDFR